MPLGYSAPPWFDPNSQYGGTYQPGFGQGSFGQTPAGTQLFNRSPGTFYDVATMGFSSGNDPFSQFVRSRRGMFNSGYDAANAVNPHLTVGQYGQQQPLSQEWFRAQFNRLAPQLRGLNASNVGGGRLRWL